MRIEAAVCRAFGEPLAVEELELRGPGPGEVGVRVAACAICHSDVAYMRGAWGGPLPAVYGHEAAGVVEDVGAGVDDVAARRPCRRHARPLLRPLPAVPARPALVLRAHAASCRCRGTRRSRRPDGEPVFHALRTSAFAERVTVHASQVVPIPGDVPLESASLLACGVLTGVGAVLNTAGSRPAAPSASWASAASG